jgi:ABC-type lipoprotein release transport system permease subunit
VIALAWRNLWRQPRRTLLTVAVIMLAGIVTVFLLALQVGSYATMKDNTLGVFDGFAQVQQPKYLDDPGMRRTIARPEQLAREIERIDGVSAVALRGATYALLSRGQHSVGAFVVGVQPKVEARVSSIARSVRTGSYLSPGDAAEAVIGRALARNLGVGVGDRITLLGMARDGSVAADVLTVRGIFESGINALDRQLVELPLARFQADFAMAGLANMLVVSGRGLTRVQDALPAIRRVVEPQGLAVRAWNELEPGLAGAIHLDASTSMLWYVSLVVVVVVLLLNTLLMSVLERTREFGVLLALGMRDGAIGRMVWLELLLMLGIGLGAGMALGGGLVAWYGVHGVALPGAEGVFAQWGLPSKMTPQLSAFSLLTGPAAIALVTSVAGVFPYLRIRRLRPASAMRAV